MRGERPGLSVVALSDLPLSEACDWSGLPAREEGGDFSSSIPGSELEGLYELCSAGEALKLAARVLWRLECGTGARAESVRRSPVVTVLGRAISRSD